MVDAKKTVEKEVTECSKCRAYEEEIKKLKALHASPSLFSTVRSRVLRAISPRKIFFDMIIYIFFGYDTIKKISLSLCFNTRKSKQRPRNVWRAPIQIQGPAKGIRWIQVSKTECSQIQINIYDEQLNFYNKRNKQKASWNRSEWWMCHETCWCPDLCFRYFWFQ